MLNYIKNFCVNLTTFFSNPAGRFVSSIIFLVVILVTRCLLLCFPEFKVLIYCFSITLLFFCWKFRHKVIEKFLNSSPFQYTLLFSLVQENDLYNFRGIYGYLYLFVYFFGLIHGPAALLFWLGLDFYWWYGFLLLYFLTYLKLKRLFIYPDKDYITELNLDGSLQFIKNPNDYNWEFVVKIMNSMAQKWAHINVRNRVSYPLSKGSLPNVGARFMVTGDPKSDAVKEVIKISKENPRLAGAVFGVFAVTAVATGVVVHNLEIKKVDAKVQIEKYHEDSETERTRIHEAWETQRELIRSGQPSWYQKNILDKAKDGRNKDSPIQAPSIYEEPRIFNMAIKKLSNLLEFIL